MQAADEEGVTPVQPGDRAGALAAAGALRRATLAALGLIAACAIGALLIFPSPTYPESLVFLTRLCARRQDIPVAMGLAALLVACGLLKRRVPARGPLPGLTAVRALAIVAGVVALAWLIRTQVLFDHDFTRDEQMASFDAAIYGAGRVFWPISPIWRPYYIALNDLFLFPVADRSAWVSNYLPVNALIRALAGKVVPMALVSPLLTGVAGLALWRVARRIWPAEPGTQMAVMLCFVGSSQVVLTGGAAFAMSAHLALNLLWLACFLRATRAGHAGAIVIGLFATGIHQPVFHPLFVLPFLDLLRRRGEWRTLACYLAGYLAIGLFWLAWPHWVLAQIAPGPGPGAVAAAQQTGLIDRLALLLAVPDADALWVMAANLLRFIAWQHVLLVPLALLGARRFARADDLARALMLGIVLLLAAMTILLPPQGHGWGYRYLHGLIGNACLLAGYGWSWLAARQAAPGRAMVATTLVSLALLLPLHGWMVRGFIAPFAEARAAFARTDADVVVFESGIIPFDTNFVINRPDLSNRPLLMLGGTLTPTGIARLCARGSVAFADVRQFNDVARYYEERPMAAPGPHQARLKRIAAQGGCRIVAFSRK